MDLRDLTRWNPDALFDFGTVLDGHATSLDGVGERVTTNPAFGGMWTGGARDAAAQPHAAALDLVAAQAESIRRVIRCAREVEPALRVLHSELAELRARAGQHGLVVEDDATITDAPGAAPTDAHRTALRAELDDLLRRARDLDAAAAARLARAFDDPAPADTGPGDRLSFGPASRSPSTGSAPGPIPDAGTDPAAVARWWAGLDDAERAAIRAAQPERIGNLDGIPGVDRDAANRALLDRERTRLEEVARQLREELDGNVFGGLLSNADAGLEQTVGKLAALDAVEAALAHGDRQLLVLDLSGREAMAAVAVGDVDTADHIGVFVPGAGSTVQGSLGTYDEQVAALQRETHEYLGDTARGTETVATVTWMNYQAPHWGHDTIFGIDRSVVTDAAASAGAPRLTSFLDGLDASRSETPPRITAVGHSYGAFVTGLALQDGAAADAAVFLGAPGIGTHDVADLGLGWGEAYLVEAEWDLIADSGRFGGDPSTLTGLRDLSADAGFDASGDPRSASRGHSEYLVPGTMSAFNVATVIAGGGSGR